MQPHVPRDASPQEFLRAAIFFLEEAVMRSRESRANYSAKLGEAYLLDDRPRHAAAQLLAASESGAAPKVAYLLGEACLRLGIPSQADEWAGVAIKESGDFQRAFVLRARARIQSEEFLGAIADLQEACRLSARDDEARQLLALLLARRSLPTFSLEQTVIVLEEVAPERRGGLWSYAMGCARLIQLRVEDAATLLPHAVARDPDDVALRRGVCDWHLGERDRAAELFNQAVRSSRVGTVARRVVDLAATGATLQQVVAELPDPALPEDTRARFRGGADTVMIKIT